MQDSQTARITKKALVASKVVIALLLMLAVIKLTMCQRPEDEVWQVTLIGGAQLNIPFQYLEFPYPPKSSSNRAQTVLLRADISTFRPVQNKEALNPDSIGIVVNDKSVLQPFDIIVSLYKNTIVNRPVYGPHHLGLTQMLAPPGVKQFQESELWLEGPKNSETGILICDQETPTIIPHCNFRFPYRDMIISLHFRKTNMVDWKRLRHRSETLLRSFMHIEHQRDENTRGD